MCVATDGTAKSLDTLQCKPVLCIHHRACMCRLTVLCRTTVHWHKPIIVRGLLCQGKTLVAHYNNVQHSVSGKLVSHHLHVRSGTVWTKA